MPSPTELLSLGSSYFGGGAFGIIIYVLLLAIPGLVLIGGVFWFFYSKKQYNLKVEVKIPRGLETLKEGETLDGDGELKIYGIIAAEWAKGAFIAKRGVVYIKRKGIKKIPMKPFDVKRYIQGGNILTVIQVGAEQYIPILPGSFLTMVDDETGEEGALLKTRINSTQDRAWSGQFEREAKATYSIIGLLREYAQFIGIGLILAFNFIGFAILYGKVT